MRQLQLAGELSSRKPGVGAVQVTDCFMFWHVLTSLDFACDVRPRWRWVCPVKETRIPLNAEAHPST